MPKIGIKQIIENSRAQTWDEQLVLKLVSLNSSFRGLRIAHGILVFSIFACRSFFATLLTIMTLSYDSGEPFAQIPTFLQSLVHSTMAPGANIGTLTFFLSLNLVCSLVLYWQLCGSDSNRKTVTAVGIVLHALGPLQLRFCLMLLLSQQTQAIHTGLKVMAAVGMCLCLCHQIIHCFVSSSLQPKNENLLVHKRNNQILWKQFLSLLLVVFTLLIDQFLSASYQIRVLFILFHVALSGLTLKTLCLQFYFHNQSVQFLYGILCCLQFTLGFASSLASITEVSLISQNMVWVVAVVTSLMFWAGWQYSGYRSHEIILVEVGNNIEEMDLQSYIHVLADSLQDRVVGNTKLEFILNSLRNLHREKCKSPTCVCRIKSKDQDDKMKFENFLIKNEVKKVLELSQKNFKLILYCCYFNLTLFNAFPDLLYRLQRLKKQIKLSFMQKYEYQCFKNELKCYLDQRKFLSNAVSTQTIQTHDRLIVALSKGMQQISSQKFIFWSNLRKKLPDLKMIDKSVKMQNKLICEIDSCLPQILSLFARSKIVMQLTYMYEMFIKMKGKESKEVHQNLKAYYIIKNQKAKLLRNQKFNMSLIMFQKQAVMFESIIQQSQMGIIMNVSKNITQVFGYCPENIIGQNINEIMPKSMQKQHDVILQSWRERASWDNIHKVRYIYAMTKDYVCFQSAIYLRLMQRMDSVNLLATFIKANDSDYMILNDEAVIDGIGNSFIRLLGQRAVKLPFNVICPQSDFIMRESKNTPNLQVCTVFYNVKGLEQEIDQYLYKKHQLANQNESKLPFVESIKVRERMARVTIESKSYKMGSKQFVIVKLLQTHSAPENESKQNKDGGASLCTSMFIPQNNHVIKALDDVENNQSYHASQHDSQITGENLLTNLEQKFKKNRMFSCQYTQKYIVLMAICCLIAITISAASCSIAFIFIDDVNDHSAESYRVTEQISSLSLILSRLDNVPSAADKHYQIERAAIEYDRIVEKIQTQHTDLYLEKKDNVLDRKFMIRNLAGQQKEVFMDEFFSFYGVLIKKMQQYYSNTTVPAPQMYQDQILHINHQAMVQKLNANFKILTQFIYHSFDNMNILFKIKPLLLAVMTIFIIVIVWRTLALEQGQRVSLLQALFAISDQNCQQCRNYFESVRDILLRCEMESAKVMNQANIVEKMLLQNSQFDVALQKLELQKDKSFKLLKNNQNLNLRTSRLKYLLPVLVLAVLAVTLVTTLDQTQFLNRQSLFNHAFFNFLQEEKHFVWQFISTKDLFTQATNNRTVSQEQIKKQLAVNQKRKREALLNYHLLFLLDQAKQFGGLSPQVAIYRQPNISLCSLIKNNDPAFYLRQCLGNSVAPFQRLNIVEVNSLVEQCLLSILHALANGIKLEQIGQWVTIAEEALTLKLIYNCKFLEDFELWMTEIREYRWYTIKQIMQILVCTFVFLFVTVMWVQKCICDKIQLNCWRLMVVPQKVIRCTRNIMKYIEEAISLVQ